MHLSRRYGDIWRDAKVRFLWLIKVSQKGTPFCKKMKSQRIGDKRKYN